MKKLSPELLLHLTTSDKFITADLYTITLISGTVLRYADFDMDIIYNGNTYIHDSILITSETTRTSIGLGVDDLSITINTDNNDIIVNGLTFIEALRVGYMDQATISLDIAWLNPDGSVIGITNDFIGALEAKQFSSFQAAMSGKALSTKFGTQLPRNIYAASCINPLYGEACKVNKDSFTFNGQLLAGSDKNTLILNGFSAQVDGYFNRGAIEFTSGNNTTVRTSIKSHTGNTIVLSRPLPYPVNIGDQFFIYAGCDKTQATCKNKFNNFLNNRSYSYIPNPEVATF